MKTSKILYSALCYLNPGDSISVSMSAYCCLCIDLATLTRSERLKAKKYLNLFKPENDDASWWRRPNETTQGERFMAIYWCYLDALAEERTTKRAKKPARSRSHLATFNTTNK